MEKAVKENNTKSTWPVQTPVFRILLRDNIIYLIIDGK
jgi:hypothetical protein